MDVCPSSPPPVLYALCPPTPTPPPGDSGFSPFSWSMYLALGRVVGSQRAVRPRLGRSEKLQYRGHRQTVEGRCTARGRRLGRHLSIRSYWVPALQEPHLAPSHGSHSAIQTGSVPARAGSQGLGFFPVLTMGQLSTVLSPLPRPSCIAHTPSMDSLQIFHGGWDQADHSISKPLEATEWKLMDRQTGR